MQAHTHVRWPAAEKPPPRHAAATPGKRRWQHESRVPCNDYQQCSACGAAGAVAAAGQPARQHNPCPHARAARIWPTPLKGGANDGTQQLLTIGCTRRMRAAGCCFAWNWPPGGSAGHGRLRWLALAPQPAQIPRTRRNVSKRAARARQLALHLRHRWRENARHCTHHPLARKPSVSDVQRPSDVTQQQTQRCPQTKGKADI
jgi:hypothetical protein